MAFKRKKVVLKVFFPFHRNIVLDLFVKSSSLLAELSSFSMICSHFYKHQGGSRHTQSRKYVLHSRWCPLREMLHCTRTMKYESETKRTAIGRSSAPVDSLGVTVWTISSFPDLLNTDLLPHKIMQQSSTLVQ